ncbi:ferritin family protein [Micromonospora robiginosa]|uniref:Ferritin family protein n=1 Tax=Micromonospora robiginosa TaxID=2749844 RepID=A0A7L6BE24_9ACTN|nr:ferritin family protein [Micromonospora ferruginea]QLQ40189.2 ferritin family protein [Micromonospora ferruginea]
MRTVRGITALVVGALLGVGLVGVPAQAAAVTNPRTRANTLTAMEGEAFAHAKYLAYGAEAARTGHDDIADLFRSTGDTELNEHFTEEAALIDFVGSDVADLRTSINGEWHEATVVYPGFARQARRDRCPRAARLFDELAADEARHATQFRLALYALTHPGSGVRVPTGEAVPPVPIVAGTPVCSGATQANLEATMRGEAFAYARYTLYARHARDGGRLRLAQLWENTAGQELGEHFSEAATLAGLVRTDADNLRDAIDGEVYEAGTMYPAFSRQAASVGEDAAADLFAEIAHDEAGHASAFLLALVDLQVGGGGDRAARGA